MCERNNQYNQNNENKRQERHDHGQFERRDYKNINERVEETNSTKNPPKER